MLVIPHRGRYESFLGKDYLIGPKETRIFSHAVKKTPQKGESRVNSAYGGILSEAFVSKSLRSLGGHLVNHFFPSSSDILTKNPLFLGFDGVFRKKSQFLITEIEAVDPYLYLLNVDSQCTEIFVNALRQRAVLY